MAQHLFHKLPLTDIRPLGWLRNQIIGDLERGFTGHLDTLTTHASRNMFRQRIETSEEQRAWWNAETRGNWLWGYTWMAFLTNHPQHTARAEALLHDLLATQDADGYLGIYSPQARYAHGDSENGELWAQGRALLALLTYHAFTGADHILQAVERAARLTMAHYGPGRSYFRTSHPLAHIIGVTHGLCYVDVMAWLYDITGDTAYRDFGVWLYDDFSALPLPFANDDLSARSLADPQRALCGHAPHTAEHLRVRAWAVTGRDDLRDALAAARRKFAYFTLPSGALLGDEGLHGMPLPEAGYEYCTTTEYLTSLTQTLAFAATDADLIERLAFNAAQGARLPDGSALAYLSQDTRLDARASRPDSYSHVNDTAGRFKFSPTHEDVACCCNPNSGRLLPQYISAQWMRLGDQPGVAALLFGACELTTDIAGVRVRITQATDYPFGETLRFTVQPAQPVAFRLCVRQPQWAEGAHVTVNGSATQPVSAGPGLLALDRVWAEGDTVDVTFGARVRVVPYPDGTGAVMRGPLHYVLPIAASASTLRVYDGSPLADLEFTPQRIQDAYRMVFLDPTQPDYGLTFEQPAGVERNWYATSMLLVADDFVLVPMGCTVLRRASFPLRA